MTDLGHLHRVAPSVLDEDPFWAVVRRRHPDVGVVLHEGDRDPEGPVGRGLDGDALTALTDEFAVAWSSLLAAVADTRSGASTSPPWSLRWAPADGGHALLVSTAVPGPGLDAATRFLRRLAARLDGSGWRFRPSYREGRPVLAATSGLLDLRAEAGEAATCVRLASGVLPLGEGGRDLLGGEVAGVLGMTEVVEVADGIDGGSTSW